MRLRHTRLCWLLAALCWPTLHACQTTRFHERNRIADRCMRLDADPGVAYIRTKAEAAREGAFGGFGKTAAGGCGCE